MRKLIIFLIRRRLGLKKGEFFRFTNQRDKSEWYYFTETMLMKKLNPSVNLYGHIDAHVSLNWILDPECEVEKVKFEDIFSSTLDMRRNNG